MYKLLFVDDEVDLLDSAKRHFKRRGYEVFTALDGKQALEIIPRIHPDLIVTDVTMPNINGFELCKTLKNAEKTKHIPIIVLTAYPKTEDSLLYCGVQDFLIKPFSLENLAAAIEKNIQKINLAQKTKILIYADQQNNGEVINKLLLADQSLEPMLVTIPEDIIQKALSWEPHIVLIDIFLYDPPVNEMIKALRCFWKMKKAKIFTYYFPPADLKNNSDFKIKFDELKDLTKLCNEGGLDAFLGAFDSREFLPNLQNHIFNTTAKV